MEHVLDTEVVFFIDFCMLLIWVSCLIPGILTILLDPGHKWDKTQNSWSVPDVPRRLATICTTITMWLHVWTCIISPNHLMSCQHPPDDSVEVPPVVCCHGDWHDVLDTSYPTVEQH